VNSMPTMKDCLSSPALLIQRLRNRKGFTLLELLVTISIIGLLAGILVGLAPMASRRMKESRMQAELTQLVTLIDEYKSRVGNYPPDNATQVRTNKFLNPLYYELTGTIITNSRYMTVDGHKTIAFETVRETFGLRGFNNSARDRDEVRFSAKLKDAQFKEFTTAPHIDLIAVPMRGPIQFGPKRDLNPWYYDSSSTNRNNETYDLWADVIIGGRVYRFSNWSKTPLLIQ
jgi:prepilin-type N-terminal cleavage/methylation domain-containing protein